MLLIFIPTPCHEKWSEMTSNEQGAFCGVCSKTVIDFTGLSDEQVKNYFLQNRSTKTCGRFRNDQIADSDNSLHQLLTGAMPFWKKFLAIVVIVFSSFLTGCQNETTGKLKVQGDISILEPELKGSTLGQTEQGEVLTKEEEPALIPDISRQYSETIGTTVVIIQENEKGPIEQGACLISEKIDYPGSVILDENGNKVTRAINK